jgi:hypothetical protein
LDAGIPEDHWMQILDSVVRKLNVDVECTNSEDKAGVLKVGSLVLIYRPRKDEKLITCWIDPLQVVGVSFQGRVYMLKEI